MTKTFLKKPAAGFQYCRCRLLVEGSNIYTFMKQNYDIVNNWYITSKNKRKNLSLGTLYLGVDVLPSKPGQKVDVTLADSSGNQWPMLTRPIAYCFQFSSFQCLNASQFLKSIISKFLSRIKTKLLRSIVNKKLIWYFGG